MQRFTSVSFVCHFSRDYDVTTSKFLSSCFKAHMNFRNLFVIIIFWPILHLRTALFNLRYSSSPSLCWESNKSSCEKFSCTNWVRSILAFYQIAKSLFVISLKSSIIALNSLIGLHKFSIRILVIIVIVEFLESSWKRS